MAIESRGYPRMTVTPKAERSIKNGHPWVYGGEVTQIEGEPQMEVWRMCCPQRGAILAQAW